MKIAIMADSHDHKVNLGAAIDVANKQNCEYVLHAGDMIGPGSVKRLGTDFKGQVIYVFGNNDGDKARHVVTLQDLDNVTLPEGNATRAIGEIWEGEIDGVRFFMNHYQRIAELAAKSGEFDVVIFGHSHVYSEEMLNDCLLVNPGAISELNNVNSTFMIFDTDTKEIEKIII